MTLLIHSLSGQRVARGLVLIELQQSLTVYLAGLHLHTCVDGE